MKTIDIFKAESLVREMANAEHIEDRVYELAQELATKYIDRVAKENRIVDVNGESCDNEDGEDMWYDEARDDAMKILFEKMSEFFRA